MTTQEQCHEQTEAEHRPKQKRGFALLESDQMREIARQGGEIAQTNGTANKWTSETADWPERREDARLVAIESTCARFGGGGKGGAAKLGYRRNKIEPVREPKESSDE